MSGTLRRASGAAFTSSGSAFPTPRDFNRFELDDIDGDGRADFLLAARQTCGAHNCTAEVYATSHGCLRRLATVTGAAFSVLPARHRRLHDIEGAWRMGDSKPEMTVFRFDGSRYIELPASPGDGSPAVDID